MRCITLGLSLALACMAPAVAQQVTPVPKEDPEMNAAIAKAKQTLDAFLQVKATGESGASSFAVKVMLSNGRDREHVWVWPFRALGQGFEGILKSYPRVATQLKFGQQISFTRDQITDWGYTKNGKNVGYRTVCVVFKRDAAAKADAERNGIQYECAP